MYVMRTRGAYTSKSVLKKSLLSYFVVFGDDFHCCVKGICYDYFPVSHILYSLFLYGLVDLICESFPVRNGGGGLDGKEYVHNGGRNKRMCA